MHPLAGSKLKIVRAQKHLDSLREEIGRYLDAHPHEFPTQVQGDLVTVGKAVITVEPPGELGCIFGDCIYSLRASLDYIAWQLALRHAKRAIVVGKDKIYFPIIKNAVGSKANGPTQLETKYSIPTAAIDLIESVQPYHSGYEPLALLSDLGNADKHRLPLLTIARADTTSMSIGPVDGPVVTALEGFASIGVHQQGAGPFVLNFAGASGSADDAPTPGMTAPLPRDVKVDGKATIVVSLSDPLMPNAKPVCVCVTLTQLVKCVADIIPRFESFFV